MKRKQSTNAHCAVQDRPDAPAGNAVPTAVPDRFCQQIPAPRAGVVPPSAYSPPPTTAAAAGLRTSQQAMMRTSVAQPEK